MKKGSRLSIGFYPKLAFTNLRKNSKTYLPYLFTCIVTVLLFYVLAAITANEGIESLRSGDIMSLIMRYALTVTGIFSAIFLFYTNSILMKQRKRELGLYYILGMNKMNLVRMLGCESMITGMTGILTGLAGGIILGKLLFLILLKLVRFETVLGFGVEGIAVLQTIVVFGIVFLGCFLYNTVQVTRTNAIELLHGSQVGEKEPKLKMIMTLIGFATLSAGYLIAQTTENPLSAIGNLFIAVLLVIVGTYALFTAGSIAVLKFLKSRKNFYYQTRRFTAVSGMLYRMKQNAVGLANICIMSTAVLALISVTLSLYLGIEDIISYRYPSAYENYVHRASEERIGKEQQIVEEECDRAGVRLKNRVFYTSGGLSVIRDDNHLLTEVENSEVDLDSMWAVSIIPLDDYNRIEKTQTSLGQNEVLLYTEDGVFDEDVLWIGENEFHIKERPEEFRIAKAAGSQVVKRVFLVMESRESIESLVAQYGAIGADGFAYMDTYDMEGTEESCQAAWLGISRRMQEEMENISVVSREEFRESEYGMCGGFLFIGVFVGFLFLTGTILIIYYKQISEGYDDRERFQIMKKVGMSRQEIKGTIRSQVLMVFFLPLGTAIIHIAFAFKIFSKVLVPFGLVNTGLELACTIGTGFVFAVFYTVVFIMTSREYYRIVQ